MRIVRFAAHGHVKYGILKDNLIGTINPEPFARFKGPGTAFHFTGEQIPAESARLLAPCRPSKVVCVGLNYRSHAAELEQAISPFPLIFLKPSTAVIGPEEAIRLPHDYRQVDYEGELAAVIGRRAVDVPEDMSLDYVLGYTCFNDVTERIVQKEDGQWTRAKGYDTFAPMGPWIETALRPDGLGLETRVNGRLRQSGRTSDLVFPVARLVSFISRVMTLLPGDVIATGTPHGIGPLAAGDTVEVTIEGIGTLRNHVTPGGKG